MGIKFAEHTAFQLSQVRIYGRIMLAVDRERVTPIYAFSGRAIGMMHGTYFLCMIADEPCLVHWATTDGASNSLFHFDSEKQAWTDWNKNEIEFMIIRE